MNVKEDNIDLIDLTIYVMKRWKIILLTTLAFAVLLSGGKYLKDLRQNQLLKSTNTNNSNYSFSDKEKEQINYYLKCYDRYVQQKEYNSNSVLMNIDPYNVNCAVLEFSIDADASNTEDRSLLLNKLYAAYESYITDGMLVSDISSKTDMENLGELTSLLTFSSSDTSDQIPKTVFTIKIRFNNEDNCKKLADIVRECIETYQKELGQKISMHSLALIDNRNFVGYDAKIKELQNSNIDTFNNYQTQLDSLKTQMGEAQLAAISETEQGTKTTESSTQVEEKVSFNKSYFIMGAFGGVFCSVGLFVVWYLISNNIKNQNEVEVLTNARILGKISRNPKKRGDKDKTGIELVKKNIEYIADFYEVNEIFFWGNISEEDSKELERTIKDSSDILKNVAFVFSNDMFRIGKNNKYVIAIERLNATTYKEISDLKKICNEMNLKIVGNIVME